MLWNFNHWLMLLAINLQYVSMSVTLVMCALTVITKSAFSSATETSDFLPVARRRKIFCHSIVLKFFPRVIYVSKCPTYLRHLAKYLGNRKRYRGKTRKQAVFLSVSQNNISIIASFTILSTFFIFGQRNDSNSSRLQWRSVCVQYNNTVHNLLLHGAVIVSKVEPPFPSCTSAIKWACYILINIVSSLPMYQHRTSFKLHILVYLRHSAVKNVHASWSIDESQQLPFQWWPSFLFLNRVQIYTEVQLNIRYYDVSTTRILQ